MQESTVHHDEPSSHRTQQPPGGHLSTLRIVVLTFLLAPPLALLRAQSLAPVPQLDESKFPGTWYEIAHLPNKREKNCVRDLVQLIAVGDKTHQFQFVFSCTDKNGYDSIVNKTGHAKQGSGDISIPSVPFLTHTRYTVFAIDPAYQWALTGSPNHKDLWILSRTPTLDAAALVMLTSRAATQGFDASKLVLSPPPTPIDPSHLAAQ